MESRFRSWVTENGRFGPSGEGGFVAEPERYHLYVSYACPWAHRTLIFRKLKKLEDVISVSVVHPYMGEQGWEFKDFPGATPDIINHSRYMHEVYNAAQPDYSGIVTVPVLWDTKRMTIVNNESSEIIRMFNSAFDAWGDASVDLYPIALRDEIDAINQRIYHTVNNGVYRAGFATSQKVYERAFDTLFETLDDLEELWKRIVFSVCVGNTDDHLRNHGFLLGKQGWRLSPVYDLNPQPWGTGLALNISETSNALDLDLAVEVAEYFRVKPKRRDELMQQIRDAVSGWESVAQSNGISTSEISRMRPAFV